MLVWAEHCKLHTQQNPGTGVFFSPDFVRRSLGQCSTYSDQNKSEYFSHAEHSQLLTTGL